MDLSQWAAALHEGLVAPGSADRLLYLYVDRTDLAEVSGIGDPEAAVKDFCAAFQTEPRDEPFARQRRAGLAWRRSGWEGNCPFLPTLAMTVLAVTEDPLGGQHGVYRRLNQLLGLPPEAKAPPGYPDHIPSLWLIWNEWLTGPGARYGRPSARTHPHWTYQGWARSQGIIRYRERLLVEDFIAGVRVAAPGFGAAPDRRAQLATLADQLLEWLRYRGLDGHRLAGLIEDEAAREIVIDVLGDEVERWSAAGRRPRPASSGSVQAGLFYDSWGAAFGGYVQVDERLRQGAVTVADEEIELSEFDMHLTLPSLLAPAMLLRRGDAWTLRPGLTARLSAAPVVVLYDEPLVGGLLQVRGKTASRSYTLLCRDDLLEEVSEALVDQAPLDVVPLGTEAPGWTWIRAVRPSVDSERLRVLGLGSIAAAPHAPISLEGGLRLSGSRYLTGGEPDLVVAGPDGLTLDGLTLDGMALDGTPNNQQPAKTPHAAGPPVYWADRGAPASASHPADGQDPARQSKTGHEARGHATGERRTLLEPGSGADRSDGPPRGFPVAVRLADRYLDPGRHEVADRSGRSLEFETVSHIRETPEASGHWASVSEALAPRLDRQSADDQTASEGDPSRNWRVSGALVTATLQSADVSRDRVALPPPRQGTNYGPGDRLRLLRSRVWHGRHALVLREDGSLVEVFPETEAWLREINLSPTTVDVLRAVRSMSPRPAFFCELAPRLQRCTAVEIPAGIDLMPGRVDEQPATHLIGDVVAAAWDLGGTGASSSDRRQRLLNLSIQQMRGAAGPSGGARSASPARRASRVHAAASPTQPTRPDILVEPEIGNPYDDVLAWISERESASASMASFAEAWAWACSRHQMLSIADGHYRAIGRMSDLGYIDPDWPRRRIHAAAPALIELSASNGLMLLTGARPPRLLERLEDDSDANPAVAEAASLWMIHRRIQVMDNLPAAPTAVYVEIDTAHAEVVLDGLAALGVHTTTDPARRLLQALPAQTQLRERAVQLAAPPARDCQRRRASLSGLTDWDPATNDNGPGLYRYRLARGDQYAFRETAQTPLLWVTRAAGLWLDDRRQQATDEQLRRLVHHTGSRALDVSQQLGLPWPVRRALTLRTGLLPTADESPTSGSALDRGTHLTFRNIDTEIADRVGQILGRPPIY